MESEKVKEIKKAWKCCGNGVHLICSKCPYIEKGCQIQLIKDTLTLINELESENEELAKQCEDWCELTLKKRNQIVELKDRIIELEKDNELLRNAKVVYNSVDYCYEDLKKAEKRIAELEKENANKTDTITDLLKKQEFYEKEKLTKFAKMLKDKRFYSFNTESYVVEVNDIDETLKEYICSNINNDKGIINRDLEKVK